MKKIFNYLVVVGLLFASFNLSAERNWAPEHCTDNFGTYEDRTSPSGHHYGVCVWEQYVDTINDGCYLRHSECEVWDFASNACEIGDCQAVEFEMNEKGSESLVCTPHSPR